MQLTRLLALVLFALFSAPAASWRQLCHAAPLMPLEDDDADDNAAAPPTEEEIPPQQPFAGRSEVVPPPPVDEDEENLDISQRLSASDVPVPINYILSVATGQFVAITRSGRVQANTKFGRLVTEFHLLFRNFDGREHVSIRSTKYESRGWFLTVNPNGRVRGSIPSNGNEIFEVVSMPSGSFVALKLRGGLPNEGSGDLDNTVQPCYLGFAEANGRPSCYSSSRYTETRVLFLDAST